MREKIRGIVISIVRHTEKINIVSLYTRERGRLSFLSPRGSGKAGKLRDARLLPMAVIESDINFNPNKELQRLGSFSLLSVWNDIYFHPMKRDITLFISEFLNRLLLASMADPKLWDYVYNTFKLLDRSETRLADFHIVFLLSLLSFTGIRPDIRSYHPGEVFDMRTGSFSSRIPLHNDWINPEDSEKILFLCRLNFSNIKALKLTNSQRKNILNYLLKYYEIHYPGTSSLKSLDILSELYSS